MCICLPGGAIIYIEKNNPDALWKTYDELDEELKEKYGKSLSELYPMVNEKYESRDCNFEEEAEYYIKHQLDEVEHLEPQLNPEYLVSLNDWDDKDDNYLPDPNKPFLLRDWLRTVDWIY